MIDSKKKRVSFFLPTELISSDLTPKLVPTFDTISAVFFLCSCQVSFLFSFARSFLATFCPFQAISVISLGSVALFTGRCRAVRWALSRCSLGAVALFAKHCSRCSLSAVARFSVASSSEFVSRHTSTVIDWGQQQS